MPELAEHELLGIEPWKEERDAVDASDEELFEAQHAEARALGVELELHGEARPVGQREHQYADALRVLACRHLIVLARVLLPGGHARRRKDLDREAFFYRTPFSPAARVLSGARRGPSPARRGGRRPGSRSSSTHSRSPTLPSLRSTIPTIPAATCSLRSSRRGSRRRTPPSASERASPPSARALDDAHLSVARSYDARTPASTRSKSAPAETTCTPSLLPCSR